MRVADERDAAGDGLQGPLQAEPGGGLGWGAAPGAPGSGDAIGGAGEVEQVVAFGLVELQRPGERFQDAGRGAGDLAPLEAGVVLDAQTCQGRDLAAPQSRNSSAPGGRKPGLVQGDAGAAGGEELTHLLPNVMAVVHALERRPR